MNKKTKIGYWMGTPVEELSKKELLEVIKFNGQELKKQKQDIIKMIEGEEIADALNLESEYWKGYDHAMKSIKEKI